MTPANENKLHEALVDLKIAVAGLTATVASDADHKGRIRRLEMVVVAIVAAMFGDAAGLNIPLG